MKKYKKEPGKIYVREDDCSILTVDLTNDEDHEPNNVVNKITENGKQPVILEPPILISDDEDDNINLEGPILIEEDSCDEGQNFTKGKAPKAPNMLAVSQPTCDVAEQGLGKSPSPKPNDREANSEITGKNLPTNEEPAPVVEQPRKRKQKSKNICVEPAVGEQKKRGPSKKKVSPAKDEKCETEKPRCKIPGCFLMDIENLKQYSGKNFKQKKDELVQKLYNLFNSSVFDKKLPEKIDIGWNKKMLRTAGLCSTGERQYPKRERYARIEIALKVCDSADRLRDTLIHEICHAASWLLDGIRDSHGDMWKYYAKKSNMVHPELPMVTRCHNYKINYKIQYECTQCKSRIGRYTRSLNTDRFICAICRGPLVVLPLTRKDGTPIAPHVRPFARFVQLNYRRVMRQIEGINHGDVMKQLSKDYVVFKQSLNR
ncbi:Acidic repeat-containing protein [Tupaia chinensis]|uniref:Acidic repeat-containing protein n=1 Tax=Tupaia chinensis TaxID=246437 RepID=L9JDJ5_TUPCH|nr:Acidic repeat-containing protein [Tupaia chinensis]